MRKRYFWVAAFAAWQLAAPSAHAADIDVVLPMTGGASFLGQGQKDTLEALSVSLAQTNPSGPPIHFVYHDDQTSPQIAVQLTSAILQKKPSVVIGSSLVGMCLAMTPLMKTTTQYCLSPGIHPKPGSNVFSAGPDTKDQIAAVVRYYRMKGWTKLALLNTTDATGVDGDRTIDAVLAEPENKGAVSVVAREHFNPTDVSIAAQMERIRQSGAQAIIAWVTGAPAATVFRAMSQAGLDLPVAPTSGNQTFAAMHQWKSFLPKQLILASAIYPKHDSSIRLPAAVEAAQKAMYAVMTSRNLAPDNQVATSWDAGLIVATALRRLGPGATGTQVSDFIKNLTGFAGVDGIYDFKSYPQRGLGPQSSTVTTYDPVHDAWVWLSEPGGAPLP